ncbi:hypothetical protein LINPERHAP1_LOCUS15983, partial [Linum perenne]
QNKAYSVSISGGEVVGISWTFPQLNKNGKSCRGKICSSQRWMSNWSWSTQICWKGGFNRVISAVVWMELCRCRAINLRRISQIGDREKVKCECKINLSLPRKPLIGNP